MESLGCMMYMCSPKLRSLQELQDAGLHLADLAQHDVTRDLVLLNQQRLAEMELTNQLERKKVGQQLLVLCESTGQNGSPVYEQTCTNSSMEMVALT